MHTPFFIEDLHEPNYDITDPAQYLDWYFVVDEPHRSRLMEYFKATGTDIVISGHVHCRKSTIAEGIRFDIAPSTALSQMEDRWPDGDPTFGFLKYDVSDKGIEYNFIPLVKVSRAKGSGQIGHTPLEQCGHIMEWEK